MIHNKIHRASGKDVELSSEALDRIHRLMEHYPEGQQRSVLLPALHIVQEENNGHLSVEAMDKVATLLGIQPIEVYEVATFYTMFNLDPVGNYVIDVCRTSPCAICGGEQLLEYLKKSLGIDIGETTADGLFTLNAVECLGACGSAPVLQVNTEFHEFMIPEKIDSLLEELRRTAKEAKPKEATWAGKFF